MRTLGLGNQRKVNAEVVVLGDRKVIACRQIVTARDFRVSRRNELRIYSLNRST